MYGLLPVICVQIGIIFLAGVVHASLQCDLGALLLLYHASLGKHIKQKTRKLVSSYILGSALLICLILSTIIFLITTFAESSLSLSCLIVIAGVLFILALLIWFFYYKNRRTTQLWLPQSVARHISNRAKFTENNIEAFSLGMLTAFAEMPFSFVLMLAAADSIALLPLKYQIVCVVAYTIIAILPLFILRISVKRGSTVVDIQKWRVRNKNFFKALSGFLFLTLAVFIVAFRIMGA